ncbi:hypothetical protein NDN08_000652 [Rhodosorus marinus]|uniref:phosphoserine phosphatase n=1 Tax=Rhodosorus marinus TaxID=101924 RepID=A0AAV8UNK9_9RHOD|nr:hypothetical protein NDN08_000652 [Rhodosorus marinus]
MAFISGFGSARLSPCNASAVCTTGFGRRTGLRPVSCTSVGENVNEKGNGAYALRDIGLQARGSSSQDVDYAVTLLELGVRQDTQERLLMDFSELLKSLSIETRNMRRLSNKPDTLSVEINVTFNPQDEETTRRAFAEFSDTNGVDCVLQKDAAQRRMKRLALFDLDSTLIQMETADTIARHVGKGEECAVITQRAMNGEIRFEDSLFQRVRLLKGVDLEALDSVKQKVPYTAGAQRLMRVLSNLGCTTCVCSGGFTFLTDHVRDALKMDASFSNTLGFEDRKLTGEVLGQIVDAERKKDILINVRTFLKVHPDQVLAVGDGANDIPMLEEAGLGVGFNAKEIVKQTVKAKIDQPSMDSILYLLGLDDADITALGG